LLFNNIYNYPSLCRYENNHMGCV